MNVQVMRPLLQKQNKKNQKKQKQTKPTTQLKKFNVNKIRLTLKLELSRHNCMPSPTRQLAVYLDS